MKNKTLNFRCGHPKLNNTYKQKRKYFNKTENKDKFYFLDECKLCKSRRNTKYMRIMIPRKTNIRYKILDGKRVYYRIES